MKRHRLLGEKGFTLLEILIALLIFAVLATLTSTAMYHVFTTRTRVNEKADRLMALQLTMLTLQRDIEQITPRSIRGNEQHAFAPLIGLPNYLEFTREGFPNPGMLEKRSTLKRMALLCQKDQLIRRTWSVLDTPAREKFRDKVLLDGLTHCHFAYLNKALQVLPQWRANLLSTQAKPREPIESLPKAIQCTLETEHSGKATLLFIIPGALYATV